MNEKRTLRDIPTKQLPSKFNHILVNNLLSLEGVSVFIVDILPDGEFRYFYINPEHQEKVGGKTKIVLGKRPEDILSPEEAATVRRHYVDCIESCKPTSYEETLTLQGKKTWWATHLQPRMDASGAVIQILGTSSDITGYKEQEDHLKRTALMEEMISNISTDFINLPTEAIDSGINTTLETIGRHMGADRSYLFVYDLPKKQLKNTHEWCAEGIPPEINNYQNSPIQEFPWINLQILGGLTVNIPSIKDLPEDASREKEVFTSHGIRSMVDVPIAQGKQIFGFIGFDAVREQKAWDEDTILMLRLVGQIISNALMRREVDRLVIHSKELLLSTQRLAGVASFEMSIPEKQITWSEKANEVLGGNIKTLPAADEELAEIFHPQYRERIISALMMTSGKKHGIDLEILLATNDLNNHFLFRTKAVFDANGKHIRTIGSLLDITQRKKIESALNHQLEMEKVLTGISNRFNRASSSDLTELFHWTLLKIGVSAQVDNDFILLLKAHSYIPERFIQYEQRTSSILEPALELSSIDQFQWLLKIINNGDFVKVDDIKAMPGEASAEFGFFSKNDVKSLLVFPLLSSGQLLGIIGFSMRSEFRIWTDDDVRLMKFLSEIITSGIARINALKELEENYLRYQTIYQNSPLAIWEEDFSAVKQYLNNLKSSGVKDIRKWLKKHPQKVAECISLIKIIAVNNQTDRRQGSMEVGTLPSALGVKDLQANLNPFIEELIAIDEDKRHFFVENLFDSYYSDHPIFTNLYWTVAPGSEESWEKVIVSTVDVTRQVESDRRLRESEERLRLVLDSAEDIILMQDLDGKYLYYNVVPGFGMNEEDIVGLYPEDVYSPEDAANIKQNLQKVIETKEPLVTEIMISREGEKFWFSDVLYPIYSTDGKMVAIGTIGRNITKRKLAESELVATQTQLTERVKELEQRNEELILLSEMLTMLQYSKDLEEGFIVVGQYLRQLFHGRSGSLLVIDQQGCRLSIPSTWGRVSTTEMNYNGNDCWAIRRCKPYLLESTENGIVCKHIADRAIPSSTYCLPIIIDSEAVGAVHLESYYPEGTLPTNIRRLAETAVEQISLALTNIHLRHSLRMQAIHDPLTGLYNRLYLEESLSRELYRLDRSGQPLSIVIMDLDNLKEINDRYGHPAGDAILRELGKLLKHLVRVSDMPCRYGGDEFILVLPDTNMEAAIARAIKIRDEFERISVPFGTQTLGSFTISVGVSSSPENGHTSQDLIAAADKALYSAKKQGRNKVCSASSNQE